MLTSATVEIDCHHVTIPATVQTRAVGIFLMSHICETIKNVWSNHKDITLRTRIQLTWCFLEGCYYKATWSKIDTWLMTIIK